MLWLASVACDVANFPGMWHIGPFIIRYLPPLFHCSGSFWPFCQWGKPLLSPPSEYFGLNPKGKTLAVAELNGTVQHWYSVSFGHRSSAFSSPPPHFLYRHPIPLRSCSKPTSRPCSRVLSVRLLLALTVLSLPPLQLPAIACRAPRDLASKKPSILVLVGNFHSRTNHGLRRRFAVPAQVH